MKTVRFLSYYIKILFIGIFLAVPSVSSGSLNVFEGQFDLLQVPSYDLAITSIEDGFGLVLEVSNTGSELMTNIVLHYETMGGIFILPFEKSRQMADLLPGESAGIDLRFFGIGFGQLTELPEIMITLSADHINDIQRRITAMVLGPLVRIVGIYYDDNASFNGYTIFSPEYGTQTYLMDNAGTIVHTWESNYIQGFGVQLLVTGHLVRTGLPYVNPTFSAGGLTGLVEIYDWNGTLQWEFFYSDSDHCLHHGLEVLPNGNLLLISWEYKTKAEAIAAGRNPSTIPYGSMWPDHIIEVEPTSPTTGETVWEWHVWDHLIQDYDPTKDNYGVVAEHPELIDINYDFIGKDSPDFNHINAVDYNVEYDQILLSAHNQNEVWVIDHSTTTEEAAGHSGGQYEKGGDLLYRWGNPRMYQAGGVSDQQLFGQHDAQWISPGLPGEGNILVFNNGQGRPDGRYSSVDEFAPPVNSSGYYTLDPGGAYGPDELIWRYTAEELSDLFAGHISGCQRLPNGNTLICDGPDGYFFEVTADQKIVWTYLNIFPSLMRNDVVDIERYALDYPGLQFPD